MEQTVLSIRDDEMATRGELIEYPAELIGGRNYLLNSNKLSSILYSMDSSTVLVSEEEEGIYNVKTEGGITPNKVRITQRNDFQIGDNVTISFWINNKTNTDMGVLLRGIGGNAKTIPANYAGFFWFSVEKTIDFNNLLYFQADTAEDNLDFDIGSIKLEKGNNPTPWTPAPEDLGLSYPDWVTEFKPSISENGILAPEFDESGVLSFSINRTTAQEFIENPNL